MVYCIQIVKNENDRGISSRTCTGVTNHRSGGTSSDAEAHVLQPFLGRLLRVMKVHASELHRSTAGTATVTIWDTSGYMHSS